MGGEPFLGQRASLPLATKPGRFQVLEFLVGIGVVHLSKVDELLGVIDPCLAIRSASGFPRINGLCPNPAFQRWRVATPANPANPDWLIAQ